MFHEERFICDYCGASFTKSDEALKCEKSHSVFGEIISRRFELRKKYPETITIFFKDTGASVEYFIEVSDFEKEKTI